MIKVIKEDILPSIKSWHLWSVLGWLELRQRYKRSTIGPFWITISMGLLILALGYIYGELFGVKLEEYLPLLAIGLVFWVFMNGVITEGCQSFISSSPYIGQLPTNKFIFIMQTVWRNFVMLLHNFIIVIAVVIYYDTLTFSSIPVFLLGFIIVLLNLFWICLFCAITSLRFRDFPQIVASFMQIIFYITPILFSGTMLSKYKLLLVLNPFAWFIDIIRSPLVGQKADLFSYYNSLTLLFFGTLLTIFLYKISYKKIAYWI